jgi:hypothetical protein
MTVQKSVYDITSNISSMHSEKKKSIEEMLNKDRELTRRTTIILDKEERAYVDSLIAEGKEKGIKPLISKMLDVYRSMMIYEWRFPGEYYCGISRIAFVNVELINVLIQEIPKQKWRDTGKNMGEALKVSMETTLNLQTIKKENWENVFKRLKVQGFGDFYLKDKYLLIKTPFISDAEIWAGFLEGLLGVELDLKTSAIPIICEIKRTQ